MSELKQPNGQAILYQMFYRQGSNPHPQQIFFNFHSADMKNVVERAKRHCDVMGYRFVHIKPFLIDLDTEEAKLMPKEH